MGWNQLLRKLVWRLLGSASYRRICVDAAVCGNTAVAMFKVVSCDRAFLRHFNILAFLI